MQDDKPSTRPTLPQSWKQEYLALADAITGLLAGQLAQPHNRVTAMLGKKLEAARTLLGIEVNGYDGGMERDLLDRIVPLQVNWLPITRDAPGDVLMMAEHTPHPALGQHIGKVGTLPDGRWLVLKFSQSGDRRWEGYFILPEPPR